MALLKLPSKFRGKVHTYSSVEIWRIALESASITLRTSAFPRMIFSWTLIASVSCQERNDQNA
jgi:hypothetical protein